MNLEDRNSRLAKVSVGANFPWKGNYKLQLRRAEAEDFGEGLKRMMVEAIDNFCIQHEKASSESTLQTKHICISELGEGASIVQVRRSKKPCKVKKICP
jgi:hypothetical protein